MSTARPTVCPNLIASIIEATPDRVRRRLDREPDAAAVWKWQAAGEAWAIETSGETVTLTQGHIVTMEQVTCTCLLSPRCFHVLACLTRLETVLVQSSQEQETETTEEIADESDNVEVDEKQKHAAREFVESLGRLLRVGVANAGVVVQAGLLRAVHQCRAEGLHRLAALGLRVIAGTGEYRTRATAADPIQLAEDAAEALETCWHVLGEKAVASFWIGTARRRQIPVSPRKLHGLFAEPIITRSGYAGAAAYFLGEDGRIYTASDVRPGDAQHARNAYLGGIEMGPLVQPAKQLARGLYLGTDLTASQDGRLGRGKGVRIVEQGQSTWHASAIQERFRQPLTEQWNAVYAHAALPADARPAGWDFVFLEGTILGALGPELLMEVANDNQPIRLAIENESESLFFRENLRMLSHAPGLRLQVIARLHLQDPRLVSPLAVAEPSSASEQRGDDGDRRLRLELPKSLAGRVCLGFDELQRHFIPNAQAAAVVLGMPGIPGDTESPLDPLRRRWIAAMLAGLISLRSGKTSTLTSEAATLNRNGFATGAALLDALSRSHANQGPTDVETFLATAIYLRTCSQEWAKAKATLGS